MSKGGPEDPKSDLSPEGKSIQIDADYNNSVLTSSDQDHSLQYEVSIDERNIELTRLGEAQKKEISDVIHRTSTNDYSNIEFDQNYTKVQNSSDGSSTVNAPLIEVGEVYQFSETSEKVQRKESVYIPLSQRQKPKAPKSLLKWGHKERKILFKVLDADEPSSDDVLEAVVLLSDYLPPHLMNKLIDSNSNKVEFVNLQIIKEVIRKLILSINAIASSQENSSESFNLPDLIRLMQDTLDTWASILTALYEHHAFQSSGHNKAVYSEEEATHSIKKLCDLRSSISRAASFPALNAAKEVKPVSGLDKMLDEAYEKVIEKNNLLNTRAENAAAYILGMLKETSSEIQPNKVLDSKLINEIKNDLFEIVLGYIQNGELKLQEFINRLSKLQSISEAFDFKENQLHSIFAANIEELSKYLVFQKGPSANMRHLERLRINLRDWQEGVSISELYHKFNTSESALSFSLISKRASGIMAKCFEGGVPQIVLDTNTDEELLKLSQLYPDTPEQFNIMKMAIVKFEFINIIRTINAQYNSDQAALTLINIERTLESYCHIVDSQADDEVFEHKLLLNPARITKDNGEVVANKENPFGTYSILLDGVKYNIKSFERMVLKMARNIVQGAVKNTNDVLDQVRHLYLVHIPKSELKQKSEQEVVEYMLDRCRNAIRVHSSIFGTEIYKDSIRFFLPSHGTNSASLGSLIGIKFVYKYRTTILGEEKVKNTEVQFLAKFVDDHPEYEERQQRRMQIDYGVFYELQDYLMDIIEYFIDGEDFKVTEQESDYKKRIKTPHFTGFYLRNANLDERFPEFIDIKELLNSNDAIIQIPNENRLILLFLDLLTKQNEKFDEDTGKFKKLSGLFQDGKLFDSIFAERKSKLREFIEILKKWEKGPYASLIRYRALVLEDIYQKKERHDEFGLSLYDRSVTFKVNYKVDGKDVKREIYKKSLGKGLQLLVSEPVNFDIKFNNKIFDNKGIVEPTIVSKEERDGEVFYNFYDKNSQNSNKELVYRIRISQDPKTNFPTVDWQKCILGSKSDFDSVPIFTYEFNKDGNRVIPKKPLFSYTPLNQNQSEIKVQYEFVKYCKQETDIRSIPPTADRVSLLNTLSDQNSIYYQILLELNGIEDNKNNGKAV